MLDASWQKCQTQILSPPCGMIHIKTIEDLSTQQVRGSLLFVWWEANPPKRWSVDSKGTKRPIDRAATFKDIMGVEICNIVKGKRGYSLLTSSFKGATRGACISAS